MKKYFSVTLACIVLLMAGCGASLHRSHSDGFGNRATPAVFWENGEATVTVKEIDAGLGTGLVVRKDGYVLTNWHVVAPKRMKVTAPDGSENIVMSSGKYEVCKTNGQLEVCSPAVLIKGDEKRDLALLKTSATFAHAVSFVDDRGLEPFDFVYSWANVSVLLPPSPFRGRYVNRIVPPRVGAKIEYLIMDLSLNPGGSGSPVFDGRGRCIGVAMGVTTMKGNPLGFVIPSHEVVPFLKEAGLDTTLATPDQKRSRVMR